jgi:hypothetical protein
MNRAYASTGFRFTLASIDRTDNKTWFKMGPGAEKQAKQALAVDPAHTLNLYICGPAKGFSAGRTSRGRRPRTASGTEW